MTKIIILKSELFNKKKNFAFLGSGTNLYSQAIGWFYLAYSFGPVMKRNLSFYVIFYAVNLFKISPR